MNQDIGIRMTIEPFVMRYFYSAQPKVAAISKTVNIVSESYAHFLLGFRF
jgi:hypothetical protein